MSQRTVTVELVADTTRFVELMRAGTVTMAQAFVKAQAFAKQWADAWDGVRDVIAHTSHIEVGRFEMRLEGQHQKAIALGWWDTHLDDVYADLGLPRDPHLTRGDN